MPRKIPNLKSLKIHRWRKIIGLTGGVGSGKSTVLALFRKKKAYTLDADRIVHQALKSNRLAKRKIRRYFGPQAIIKGRGIVNKSYLASLIFRSKQRRKQLEKILHPIVRETIKKNLSQKKGQCAVCDIPLLFESGWQKEFDHTVLVTAGLNTRLNRLKKRGWSKKESLQRMKAQWPLARKKKKADFHINNNGTRFQTQNQVNKIWKRILNRPNKGE